MRLRVVTQLTLVVALVGTVVGGALFLVRQSTPGAGVEILLPTATPAPVVVLKAYVTGRVERPGVYTFQDGDRLEDLVALAGGATSDADLERVNLAARVDDGDHWYVPLRGEPAGVQTLRSGVGSAKVDVNSATAPELESLPGIGQVKAEAIISYREANGPFSTVEDLLGVRGVGSATLDAIGDLVEVC